MNESLSIQSGRGAYVAQFTERSLESLNAKDLEKTQLIIDSQVYGLYGKKFDFSKFKIIVIEALENNKNIDQISSYVAKLVENKVKIDHTLVAIGGGIVQDITCFIASTLFRGMKWEFVPTTLLAQADSCIGSKSSINVGEFKNLMGTFYPPQQIQIDLGFLDTLDHKDILSGIGEILKVHMIQGKSHFEEACQAYPQMLKDRSVLKKFILQSLQFKKIKIELDEYDKGPRNVMNYGHSFGHAIEAATNFAIPHGISVTIGMDMANHQSLKMGLISESQFQLWHKTLRANYQDFLGTDIPIPEFLSAIAKDKKNLGQDLSLILVQNTGEIQKMKVKNDLAFEENCRYFFKNFFSRLS